MKSQEKPITFLILPQKVRWQIYQYRADDDGYPGPDYRGRPRARFSNQHLIALGVRDGIPYLFAEDGDYRIELNTLSMLRSYNNLRLVSRAVKADILPLIFSEYRILVHGTALQHISVFLNTMSESLRHCRRVIFEFGHRLCSMTGCHLHGSRNATHNDLRCPRADCMRARQFAAYDSDYHFRQDLQGWRRFVEHITQDEPQWMNKLQLSLYCEATDVEAAEMAVAPLEPLRLSRCLVQLRSNGDRPPPGSFQLAQDSGLQAIARRAVDLATRHHLGAGQAFRFMDLPIELRHRILSFTDLVSPLRQIHWAPGEVGFYLSTRGSWSFRGHKCPWGRMFCNWNRVAYPPCPCYRTPLSIFLVCRSVTQDARRVFYSSNRFIVDSPEITYNNTPQPSSPRSEPFEASIFLTQIVPGLCLGFLRDLEIAFTARYYTHLGIEPAVLEDWEKAIAQASPHIKRLTLTLHVGDDRDFSGHVIESEDPEAAQDALFKVHEQLTRPLHRIKGLAAFFVYARSPFDIVSRDTPQPFLRAHEKHLERLVMGDAYDSAARGKWQRRLSRWFTQDPFTGGDGGDDLVEM